MLFLWSMRQSTSTHRVALSMRIVSIATDFQTDGRQLKPSLTLIANGQN